MYVFIVFVVVVLLFIAFYVYFNGAIVFLFYFVG